MGFTQSGWLSGKESACNAGDLDSIPRLGRSPVGGNDHPFQYYTWSQFLVFLPGAYHNCNCIIIGVIICLMFGFSFILLVP